MNPEINKEPSVPMIVRTENEQRLIEAARKAYHLIGAGLEGTAAIELRHALEAAGAWQ